MWGCEIGGVGIFWRQEPKVSRQKVLIVEDQLAIRTMLMNFFSKRGYGVFQAENGFQAQKLYQTLSPQVIISDIKMPGMSGIELLQTIRSQDPEVIFILITGFGTEEMILEALRKGASNFFRKPLQIQDLFDWIENRRQETGLELPDEQEALCLEETQKTFRIKARHFKLQPLLRQLCANLPTSFGREDQRKIRLGLEEALTNAFEHGALRLTGDEKAQALEAGKLDELMRQRLDTYGDDVLEIQWNLKPTSLEIYIRDPGPGFDWPSHLGEDSDGYLANGRGLLLMRAFFDRLIYSESGNAVTLIRQRPAVSP